MLTLPIKKKWFSMILAGVKKEEYRDLTPYYHARLKRYVGKSLTIRYRNGYSTDSPTIEVTGLLDVGVGRAEWGAASDKTATYYRHHCEKVTLLNILRQ